MQEEATNVAQLVSTDVAAKFEALQNEVDLVKNEIKQTLVDLREFLMKNRTIFPQNHAPIPPAAPRNPAVEIDHDPVPAPVTTGGFTPLQGHQISAHSGTGLDTVMLGKFIEWLGSVKRLGVSLHQITPYVEAYETSGYLQPLMVKVILRSMADLDQLLPTPTDQEFSTEDYAKCVGQLHEIICPSQNGNSDDVPLGSADTSAERSVAPLANAVDAVRALSTLLEQSAAARVAPYQVDAGGLRGKPGPKVSEVLNNDG